MKCVQQWCLLGILAVISVGCGDDDTGNNHNGDTDPDTGGTDTSGDGNQTTATNTDGQEGNDSGSVAVSSLVGRWQYDDEIVEFHADGTWVMPGEGGGTWTLEGNLLGLSETESGVEGESTSEPVSVGDWDAGVEDDDPEEPEMVAYEETETWMITIAIVNDRLYVENVLIREQGSGDGLDGVWVSEEGEREAGTEGDIDYDCVEMETLSITIAGAAADVEISDHGTCREGNDEETWNERERAKGTVEIEGQVVHLMGTGLRGDEPMAIPPSPDWDGGDYEEPEEPEEDTMFTGYRLTPDIVIMDAASADEAAAEAFTRLN